MATGFGALHEKILARSRKPRKSCRECGSENIETQDEQDVRWIQCIHCGAFYSESIPGKEY